MSNKVDPSKLVAQQNDEFRSNLAFSVQTRPFLAWP